MAKDTRCRACDRPALPFDSDEPPPSIVELGVGKKPLPRLNEVGLCRPCNIDDLRFHGQAIIDEVRHLPLIPEGLL